MGFDLPYTFQKEKNSIKWTWQDSPTPGYCSDADGNPTENCTGNVSKAELKAKHKDSSCPGTWTSLPIAKRLTKRLCDSESRGAENANRILFLAGCNDTQCSYSEDKQLNGGHLTLALLPYFRGKTTIQGLFKETYNKVLEQSSVPRTVMGAFGETDKAVFAWENLFSFVQMKSSTKKLCLQAPLGTFLNIRIKDCQCQLLLNQKHLHLVTSKRVLTILGKCWIMS